MITIEEVREMFPRLSPQLQERTWAFMRRFQALTHDEQGEVLQMIRERYPQYWHTSKEALPL